MKGAQPTEGGNGASFGQLLLGKQPDCGEVMHVCIAVVVSYKTLGTRGGGEGAAPGRQRWSQRSLAFV